MNNKNIPQEILAEFTSLLNELSINYVMIGGLAISSWSAERFTRDMDLTIELNKNLWATLSQKFSSSSNFQIKQTCLDTDSSLPSLIRLDYKNYPIDLIVSLTPLQKEAISRGIRTKIFGPEVNLATPEDVIILKLIANRTQDIADIEILIQKLSDLDFPYIEKWAKEWEVLPLWQELLAKSEKKQ